MEICDDFCSIFWRHCSPSLVMLSQPPATLRGLFQVKMANEDPARAREKRTSSISLALYGLPVGQVHLALPSHPGAVHF